MRRLWAAWITIVTLICFVAAPAVIARTHGPVAAAGAAEILAHGHSHGGADQAGGHDATDHDHQFSAILPPLAGSPPLPANAMRSDDASAAALDWPDRARRPPRI